MGNMQFGNLQTFNAYWATSFHEVDPDGRQMPKPLKITHDPMEGFPNGRKPRVMVATKDEMVSARLPLTDRGYCAHKLIAYRSCRHENFPFVVLCRHQLHDLEHCEFDDYMIRIKEHEREKRLRARDAERERKALKEQKRREKLESGQSH